MKSVAAVLFALASRLSEMPHFSEHPNVLIVDRDPLVLVGIAAMLDRFGCICHCARDSGAARKAIAAEPIELVICEIELPDRSGLDLAAEMLSGDAADIPVVFTSSSSFPETIDRARASGGLYYLRKPFDPWVLVELVEKALWMPHLVKRHVASVKSEPHAPRPQRA